jgi:hypothetical protein
MMLTVGSKFMTTKKTVDATLNSIWLHLFVAELGQCTPQLENITLLLFSYYNLRCIQTMTQEATAKVTHNRLPALCLLISSIVILILILIIIIITKIITLVN